jgi:5-methyltetrahydropteroyltriglutamate--homocysteine methyltransferase
MASAHILGFPRIGAQRELKFALEAYWQGHSDEASLLRIGAELRLRHWRLQQAAGLDLITVGDFAWYDQLHNLTALFSATPTRFGGHDAQVDLPTYFAMARGTAAQPALAMKKWFDSNYHYLVPELDATTRFQLNPTWLLPEVREAQALQRPIKVVLPGPLTYLWLASAPAGFDKLQLLPGLVAAYQTLLAALNTMEVAWVQIDEPILALDLPPQWLAAFPDSYRQLSHHSPALLLATYFGSVAAHAELLRQLPVAGVHLDKVRAPEQLADVLHHWPKNRVLSLGVVDGRNVWRSDLAVILNDLQAVHAALGAYLWISASCSLLHSPVDLSLETRLDPELRSWLAFATQKLDELAVLKLALNEGAGSVRHELAAVSEALARRKHSMRTYRSEVRARVSALTPQHSKRQSVFNTRIAVQRAALQLPLLPTTTIGSFPQTVQIRQARAAYKQGQMSEADYQAAMRSAIQAAVSRQEALGLDVLVHGEAERNDMVEYFGEQLEGYAFSEYGWVQSYGSRCVKPPIIYGDISRPHDMTVAWSCYAQSLSDKPMKGMLSGPITMLQWSFVRDDLPRNQVALQLALALRDEVCALEAAGIRVIQIDEPAIREGLPLQQAQWQAYLDWAVQAFRICSAGVRDATQIHTHMCYSEFKDILPSIAAMDADVITIETSRSRMQLLDAFAEFRYPNDIGPGLYDIHSPRVPTREEMQQLLQRALRVIPAERLWINPDCGLKTRNWSETEAALTNMVATAKVLRDQLANNVSTI